MRLSVKRQTELALARMLAVLLLVCGLSAPAVYAQADSTAATVTEPAKDTPQHGGDEEEGNMMVEETDDIFKIPESKKPHTLLDTRLKLAGADVSGENITINYEVPFVGVVEFFLIDSYGREIYRNQYINPDGQNAIKLTPKKLAKGTYKYIMKYKGNVIEKTFVLS